MKWIRDNIFRITPLGRADRELKEYLIDRGVKEKQMREYNKSLNKYRTNKALHNFVKVFLYAGIITSVATTFGIDQAEYIAKIASYIGVSLLLVFYVITFYFSELYREEYHLRREILVSEINKE